MYLKTDFAQQISVWFLQAVKSVPSSEPLFNSSFSFTLRQNNQLATGTQGYNEALEKLRHQSWHTYVRFCDFEMLQKKIWLER